MPSSSLPISFRSVGGGKYPPRKPVPSPSLPKGLNLDAYDALKISMKTTPRSQHHNTGHPSSRNPHNMTLAKAERLRRTLNRQNGMAELKKQEDIALQKLTSKYANFHNDKATRAAVAHCVASVVRGWFGAREEIRAGDLEELEGRVREAAERVPETVEGYRRSFQDGTNAPATRKEMVPALNLKKKGPEKMPDNLSNEWAALTVANAIREEEKKRSEADNSRRKKAEQRAKFDLQKKEKAERVKRAQEEAREERMMIERQTREWKDQEEARSRDRARKHEELRDMYAKQVADRQAAKESERERLKRESRMEVEALERELRASEDRSRRHKAEERGRYRAMLEESKRQEEMKVKMKEKSKAEDEKLMADYKAKLDRDEAARAKSQRDRVSKYEAIGERWAKEGAGRAKAEEQRRMEELVEKEARRKNERDDERHRRDKEKLRKDKEQMRTLNAKLIEEKRIRDEEERRSDLSWAREVKAANDRQLDEERAKDAKRRAMDANHKKSLLEQKRTQDLERRLQETSGAVSSTERAMNKEMFSKLKEDGDLISKIAERVMPKPPTLRTDGSMADLIKGGQASPNARRRKKRTGGRR